MLTRRGDQLQLITRNFTTTVSLLVSGYRLDKGKTVPSYFSAPVAVSNITGTAQTTLLNMLAEGQILSVAVQATTVVQPGQLYAQLAIQNTDQPTAVGSILAAGYISGLAGLSFPGMPVQLPGTGRGVIQQLAMVDNGPYCDFTQSANRISRIIGVYCQLTTSATVGTRRVYVERNGGYIRSYANNTQAASLTRTYYFQAGPLSIAAGVGSTIFQETLAEGWLPPNDTLTLSMDAQDAGDDYATPILIAESWTL